MALWLSRFVNAEGFDLNFSQPGVYDVMGRTGDWAVLPFEHRLAQSPDGAHAAPVSVIYDRGVLSQPIGIRAPAGGYIRQWVDTLRTALRPMIDEETQNRGYLYITRISGLPAQEVWRIPAVPLPFQIDVADSRDREYAYRTEVKFRALTNYFEADPPQADRGVVTPAGSWTTHDAVLTPGGDQPCFPTWEIDGPSSGTITSVKVENLATGRLFELTGLALATNERLIITTGFMAKGMKVYAVSGGVTGAFLYSAYPRRSDPTEYFRLKPTAQTIRITKNAASTSTIRVSYRKAVGGII